MKIFHHNDNDGLCAAYLVLTYAETKDEDIGLYEMDYDKQFPLGEIQKDEEVYIVDFSISPDEMESLLKITENVTWIDHHETAIKKYRDFGSEIRGIRYNGVAGCMLTYCYLVHMTENGHGDIETFNENMMDDAPTFVKYIADWDVWKFEYGDKTKQFQIAFTTLYNRSPKSAIWYYMHINEEQVEEIIEQGAAMIAYRDSFAKAYCNSYGFECMLGEYKCFAINIGMVDSEWFSSVDADKYDIFVGFGWNGSKWKYSLRSEKVNVADIAMLYGGGGHAGAAGFSSDKLLLK